MRSLRDVDNVCACTCLFEPNDLDSNDKQTELRLLTYIHFLYFTRINDDILILQVGSVLSYQNYIKNASLAS